MPILGCTHDRYSANTGTTGHELSVYVHEKWLYQHHNFILDVKIYLVGFLLEAGAVVVAALSGLFFLWSIFDDDADLLRDLAPFLGELVFFETPSLARKDEVLARVDAAVDDLLVDLVSDNGVLDLVLLTGFFSPFLLLT